MTVRNYRELIAWQKAMDLVELIYRHSAIFPRDEIYGLTQQLRRASVSIPSNIAEGQARRTTNEFMHFLSIALGSLAEAETQIMITRRLEYLNDEQMNELLVLSGEVGRIVNGLRNSLAPNQ